MKNKAEIVRSVYFYLVALTGILMVVFSIISISNSLLNFFFREGEDLSWLLNSTLRSVAFLISGIFFFAFHWGFIVKEKRIGKRPENFEPKTRMNLFESIFFYALSYAGLMIFAFSFSGFLSNFAYVQYLEKTVPMPEDMTNYVPQTQLTVNIKYIIQNLIAMIIGAILWVISFTHTQKSYTKEDSIEENKQ